MRNRILAVLGVVITAVVLVPPSAAAEPGSVIRPVAECADLVRDYDIPGAATRVEKSTFVPEGTEPAHCDVTGVIAPEIRFQLRLPTETYGGRYLQIGCGGFCGVIFPTPFPDCGPEVGDFAVAATDDGHPGDGTLFSTFNGRFGESNQAARDDWFFRAPHVLSVAAKRIIATFYGSPPRQSYFSSCSNGGREALLLAQRYPHDFDGIIAGAPAAHLQALFGIYFPFMVRVNTSASGEPIITAAKLPGLHNAVLAACDGLDGLVDGQIDEPRACRFDPATIRCPGADAPDCLTPAQVDVARKLYAGPTDERGRRLYPGWQAYGAEPSWAGWFIPVPELNPGAMARIGDDFLRYVGYPVGTPHSSLNDLRFTSTEFHRQTLEGFKPNASSLDLGAFRRAGGKLIIWHGQADPAIPPAGTVDYYARLVQRGGGLRSTQEFARLFMVPNIDHCGAGTKLQSFDPIRELVAWVEQARAPERIIASGQTRTRPVFPYPLQAKYDGTGSIDDAANFVPHRPAPRQDIIPWVGGYLHHIPGPVAQ